MNFAQTFASLAGAVGAPFVDAVASWPGTPVTDAGGSITAAGTPASYPCKAQFDAPTQAMRAAEGFLQTDVRILVLSATLAVPLDSKARITVAAGPNAGTWALLSCQGDAAGVGYECAARRA